MKSLFLTLVFVLVTATSFAINNQTVEVFKKQYSTMVTTSCGATGMIMYDTVGEAIELAMDMDEWLCG